MIPPEQVKQYKEAVLQIFAQAGLVFTESEINDPKKFQLLEYYPGRFEEVGLVLFTVADEPRYCGRFLYFFPGQSCVEHWHPVIDGKPGKEETFRVLRGTIYACLDGPVSPKIKAVPPKGLEQFYTVKNEMILNPGEQVVVGLGEKHWFQAGPEGAVCVEFSSPVADDLDKATDPNVVVSFY